jgi:hypothetical protein
MAPGCDGATDPGPRPARGFVLTLAPKISGLSSPNAKRERRRPNFRSEARGSEHSLFPNGACPEHLTSARQIHRQWIY